MKNTNLTSKSINHAIIALFLFISPLAGAYAACCAGHGGVASCNKSTGYKICKDRTVSPTCTCAIPKKTTKSKTTKTTPPATTSTPTQSKSHWWNGKSTTTTTPRSGSKSTPVTGTSAQGCCSRHGGIAQCNKSSGHQMCKDGTPSPTCTCH
ncbi:hypothetical protein [Legionella sp.]|uniref:hypothetical protein n=1 Tax=Legionella sp. TaxID=459 RepID=UPI003CC1B9F6